MIDTVSCAILNVNALSILIIFLAVKNEFRQRASVTSMGFVGENQLKVAPHPTPT